ncbi:hypothetical protein ATK17_3731 [Branchiibius hedensis]|uniref:Uncharacterized protein n=1 Tax=Branchiibius hedensis TaxID=672460 RepID=A0A2Y9A2B9_9MICO|nr:hypothetical protein [Branchiibius hedensis]PWJ27527.1 hypothetical protein ATK17_3731 [Branchiibius hedensis]SSA36337.1 hypothetical protein SAMN04489750_3731 [Branchiibius hedensis]
MLHDSAIACAESVCDRIALSDSSARTHRDARDKAEAAIGRVRELVESADRASEESLSRVFGGHPFGASVPTPDLIRALDGETGEQS